MDSKERHEMMNNELADWIGQLPELCKQYRNQILGVLLIVVGLISWPILNRWRAESDFTAQTEVAQALDGLEMGKIQALRSMANTETAPEMTGDSLTVTAGNLAEQAKKAPNDDLAAVALIKRGQALRADLLYRKDAVTEEDAANQTKQAQEAYQQAFDKAKMPVVKAMAQFGLGICSEQLGQLEQAKEIYRKIVNEVSYTGTALPEAAKERIEKMADNNTKYTFIDLPKPVVKTPAEGKDAAAAPQPVTAVEAPAATPEKK